jgi:dTDP-glucose 4,6-dehydratase
MGVPVESVVEVVGERAGKDAAYLLSSTKAHSQLGWADHISLDEGIAQTIDWVERDLEAIKRQPQAYIHKP